MSALKFGDAAVIEPKLVVVIPTYRHPVLLTEALDSVLDQVASVPYVVIICSDGCPFPETDLLASAFALADPRIVYLRKSNGGPSSARNFAIEFALQVYPSMQALYFLDSDNRLTRTAIQVGFDALFETPGLGWVYSNIDSFGVEWAANYGAPYSPLLHVIHENLCDTGSFVSRAMLEAGVRFDEDALTGYEDWDFWLQGLSAGFRGKHTPFGFSYRQRPESRFREMNRQRGSILERLRRRHWTIASPQNLMAWEHETNPRYLLAASEAAGFLAFTDPRARGDRLDEDKFETDLWASFSAGDEVWTPAFFVFGRESLLDDLIRLGLAHNIFWLMERAAAKSGLACLSVARLEGSVSVEIENDVERPEVVESADLWMMSSGKLKTFLVDDDDRALLSLKCGGSIPAVTEVRLRAPIAASEAESGAAALGGMLAQVQKWRNSAYRKARAPRWVWRPRVLPARDEYYGIMCKYIEAGECMPRLSGNGLDIGFLVPIASYGGSEKVGYALAQTLRRRGGARTHLFVLGAAKMNLLSEYADAFDTVNFLADPEFPVWGGPTQVFGQNILLPASAELKSEQMTGFLCGLDLIVNCQSAPANSLMGSMRRLKAKTISYVHLSDTTEHGRPAGHPYLAVGFEHAYDLLVTCSRRLADEMHGLGAPGDKILPIANAASFRISKNQREDARAARAIARGVRPLRCLYLGRLDHQKGVERLYRVIELIRSWRSDVEFRIVGSNLMDSSSVNWAEKFDALGIALEPPVFSSPDLTKLFLWADVMLLPSRWEGAPLVIPECQQLGCIPICANVGAVDELIIDEVDGLLVASVQDEVTAASMAAQVRKLVDDDESRVRLALAGIQRGVRNQWETNFRPLMDWIDSAFADRRAPAAAVQAIAPN